MVLVHERGEHEIEPEVPAWLGCAQQLLATLDSRTVHILEQRVLTDTRGRPTLDELGRELDLTRERVRQIELRGKERIAALSKISTYQPLVEQADASRQALGPIFSRSELRRSLGLSPTSGVHDLEVELLLFIADLFDRQGDLFVDRQFNDDVLKKLNEALQSNDTKEETVVNVLAELGVQRQHVEAVLGQIPGVRAIDGHLVPWSGTLADKAVVILRLVGHPMTIDEMLSRVGEGSRGTLVNYFARDQRVVRRGPKMWGLTEWGGEPYESLAKAMQEELERAGGRLPLESLVRRVGERFEVVRNSIVIMAGTSPLFVSEGPWVRVRREDEPYVPDSAIEESASCVCIDAAWAWRCVVNHDVLRGSGLLIPEPLAALVGLRPQKRLELDSAYGAIPLSWSAQNPAVGSLRRPAESLGAAEGDFMFVRIDGDDVDFSLIQMSDLEEASVQDQLLLRLGQSPSPNGWQESCAEAIGLPSHANRAEIDSLLEVRGDREVLRLFRSAVRSAEVT